MSKEPARVPMTWRYCGDQLKLWRARAGVSREALAEEANYDAEYVKSMEQGAGGRRCVCFRLPIKFVGHMACWSRRTST